MMTEEITGQYAMEDAKYQAFVDKFKPKKTTDDCYTPEAVYEVVAEYVTNRYGVERERMLRPFWPGADYKRQEYPEGCVVVDNPPFSILSEIVRVYNDCGVRFFLFAPALTLFSRTAIDTGTTCIAAGAEVIYENGAKVRTSFLTNLERDTVARSDPELYRELKKTQKKKKKVPRYRYPDNVLTAAMLQGLSEKGVAFAVRRGEAVRIGTLDAMRGVASSGLFGGGLLMAEKAAAEKAAAEKAAAEKAAAEKAIVFELSEREKAIIESLSGREN